MKQQRNTKQRRLVLEAVLGRVDHPSADEIFLDVRRKAPQISRGTVYRNLSILAQSGAITHVRVPSADRFDLRTDFHYHIFCVGCGAVFDAPTPYCHEYDKAVEAETGVKVLRHRTVFEGLCPACLALQKDEPPEK